MASKIKMAFTGRKNFSKIGRVHPSVRFRQAALGGRPVRFKTSSGSLLTPAGWCIALSVFSFVVFLAWFFVFSTKFLVRKIELTAPATLSKEQLDSVFYDIQDRRILFWVPGNHILFLSAKGLSKALNQNYPYIAGVENFKKHWPDKVSFSVREIAPVFFYSSETGRRYLIDEAGRVIGEPVGELSPGLVEISGANIRPLVGRKLEGAKFLPLILDIQKKWQWSAFKPVKFEIITAVPEGELVLTTSEGWYVKITGADKAANVIKNLGLILGNEIKDSRRSLAYIDLRLSNRAFFCRLGQTCSRK